MDDVEHVIRRRAYELSEQAGCFEGRSDEFWHAARAAVSARILRAETGGLFQAQNAGEQSASLTRRNCGGFCLPGNRPGLNRTDGHRSLASLQNEAACRGFSARNDLSQRMSKSLAGKPKALTINRYLPVSLRFHSLSPRSTAMVVTCSRALRRLQE